MQETTVLLPHPVLFIMDFSNESVEIPESSPSSCVSANSSCVSVKALADVDGEVTVTLAGIHEEPETNGFKNVFEGVVDTPARKLAIVTSENNKVAEMPVPNGKTTVVVSVDDETSPSRILVKAR